MNRPGSLTHVSCANSKKLISSIMRAVTMQQNLIPATELAEFVYCSQAWHLKYERGVKVSETARDLQLIANSWHIQQGRSLARGDSYRWAAYAALLLAVVLLTFCWLGWTK
jgi:hypothetical protein